MMLTRRTFLRRAGLGVAAAPAIAGKVAAGNDEAGADSGQTASVTARVGVIRHEDFEIDARKRVREASDFRP